MGLELAILSSSGKYPSHARACSGYLFRTTATNVVVDCGPGSTANLEMGLCAVRGEGWRVVAL